MTAAPLRIATRASGLALWQANHVADLLRAAAPNHGVELVHVTTTGDRDQTGPLSQIGTLGVFTREVQAAVLDGRADIAVHSLKDLPTEPVEGLVLAAVPERAVVFDALVLPAAHRGPVSLAALAKGARVGTGSLRRRAQLLHHRSDLVLLDVRGNVETRLRKLDDGQYDALVLAAAGLHRLRLDHRISLELRPPLMYPAVGQGALGLECRAGDSDLRQLLAAIADPQVMAAVTAERTLLSELRAGCHAPVGVLTSLEGAMLRVTAVVLSPDGSERLEADGLGEARQPDAVGHAVSVLLRDKGADRLINSRSE